MHWLRNIWFCPHRVWLHSQTLTPLEWLPPKFVCDTRQLSGLQEPLQLLPSLTTEKHTEARVHNRAHVEYRRVQERKQDIHARLFTLANTSEIQSTRSIVVRPLLWETWPIEKEGKPQRRRLQLLQSALTLAPPSLRA